MSQEFHKLLDRETNKGGDDQSHEKKNPAVIH